MPTKPQTTPQTTPFIRKVRAELQDATEKQHKVLIERRDQITLFFATSMNVTAQEFYELTNELAEIETKLGRL